MTGVAEVYLFLRRPHSKDARKRLLSVFQRKRYTHQRFVVLSWKRTGSNLLCGILHNHPEIVMHNELFNPIDIFTYHPNALCKQSEDGQERSKWTFLSRDLLPSEFLEHIWTGQLIDGSNIAKNSKAIGFKSFPDHWTDANNEDVWRQELLDNSDVKKIILHRENELAVYVSMLRAQETGSYMIRSYPSNLKVVVDVQKFQAFINNYRNTFQRKYKSPFFKRDTFRITYEQLVDEDGFEQNIAPLLWKFLGVADAPPKRLKEIVQQSNESESLQDIISNYDQLEYAFRFTDVAQYFPEKSKIGDVKSTNTKSIASTSRVGSWSILLPICSRITSSEVGSMNDSSHGSAGINRFSELERTSQYQGFNVDKADECWKRINSFAESLQSTSDQLDRTECVVGIDVDDEVFNNKEAKKRLIQIIPCKVEFVMIRPQMYGKVCRIWNHLGLKARNEFIVLLGDDVVLLNKGWQAAVENKFKTISTEHNLPFGAACVAMNDSSFEGFPTFPVIHRWHKDKFGFILPQQFVNQGGDPFLFELYSRWNASCFATKARLLNTVGGNNSARYLKHDINWAGQVLSLHLKKLEEKVEREPTGICLDIVIPSYRINNSSLLQKIINLRATVHIYVKFWIVIDNPDPTHLQEVRNLADSVNKSRHTRDVNYFVNVVHYSENRGASYARNTGYNYSNADWVLFLDDDVVPEDSLLDAYVGSIMRYPRAKVMVGLTELPKPCNLWTEMLTVSNIMFFYGIARNHVSPPWGVTANIMMKGSRYNHTVQFKHLYPKTGGGEDIDFVFQMKQIYGDQQSVVGVPGAKAKHPWWRNGDICYSQIKGWAWGDSLCITEWKEKTFLTFPNWIEFNLLLLILRLVSPLTGLYPSVPSLVWTIFTVSTMDHVAKTLSFIENAQKVCRNKLGKAIAVAFGASTVISSQEITRVLALIRRISCYSFCRRMDWFDGQARTQVLDIQLRSLFSFVIYCVAFVLSMKYHPTIHDGMQSAGEAEL